MSSGSYDKTDNVTLPLERTVTDRPGHWLDHAGDPIVVFSSHKNILFANSAACQLLGLSLEQVITRNIDSYFPAVLNHISRAHKFNISERMTGQFQWIAPRYNTRKLQYSLSKAPRDKGLSDCTDSIDFVLVLRDVTQHVAKLLHFKGLAERDSLTNLYNRRFLNQYLSNKTLDRNFSLSIIDVDNFKYVNDTFGHKAGDMVLVAIARRLKSCVRSRDIVGRLGGDEFYVLTNGKSRNSRFMQDKVEKHLSKPVIVGNKTIPISCSIGVAHGPLRDIDALFHQADALMFRNKRSKKLARERIPSASDRTSRYSMH